MWWIHLIANKWGLYPTRMTCYSTPFNPRTPDSFSFLVSRFHPEGVNHATLTTCVRPAHLIQKALHLASTLASIFPSLQTLTEKMTSRSNCETAPLNHPPFQISQQDMGLIPRPSATFPYLNQRFNLSPPPQSHSDV